MIGAEELICNEGSPVKTGWIGMEVSSIPIVLIYLELSEKFWFCALITPIVCSMPFFTEHGCGKGRDLKKRMKRCFRVQRALRLVCRFFIIFRSRCPFPRRVNGKIYSVSYEGTKETRSLLFSSIVTRPHMAEQTCYINLELIFRCARRGTAPKFIRPMKVQ